MQNRLDPDRLVALAEARAKVQALEAELGLSGARGATPQHGGVDAALWAQVADIAVDLISVHAANGDYLFASPSSERLFGWRPDQLVGTNAYAYFHADDLAAITASHAAHDPSTAGSPRVRYRLRCLDGSWRWVETVSHAHSLPDGIQQIVAITRDVEDQKALEDALCESNERLRRFAGIVAHDIKSPLSTIAAVTEMVFITARERLTEDELRRLGQVHSATMRLGSRVDRLLQWASIETRDEPAVPTDLFALTRDVLDGLEADLAASSAAVHVEPLPTLAVDPELTRVLLQNLVSNAIKFSRPDRPPRVVIGADPGEGCWRLRVSDDGLGIPEDARGRIFEMFGRAAGTRHLPGQGIGLAMCARIAEKHGGRIWVESVLGAGSTFVVELPARPAAA